MVEDPLDGLDIVAEVSKGTSQEHLVHVGFELREGRREGGREGGRDTDVVLMECMATVFLGV